MGLCCREQIARLTGILSLLLLILAGFGLPVQAMPGADPIEPATGPWVSLGAAEMLAGESVLRRVQGRPLALAGADLDLDGSHDLIAGYSTGDGGGLAVYRGSAGTPHDRYTTAFDTPPRWVALPAHPDFLAIGDFNADGMPDVVVAARGGEALWVLPGDGAGNLGAAAQVALPGGVTALAAGEIHQQDGLPDLAVGVTTPEGALVLVFAGERGAQTAAPERYALGAPVIALATGQLDAEGPFDLAIAAGSTLHVLRGHGHLAWDTVSSSLTSIPLPFDPVSLAVGSFRGGPGPAHDIALLAEDGEIALYDGAGTPVGTLASGVANGGTLLRAKSSSLPADDLLVVGPADRHVRVLTAGQSAPSDGLSAQAAGPGLLATFDVAGPAVAALPVRLNGDGLDDLVILTDGSPTLSIMLTQAAHVFGINSRNDYPDKNPGDGICKSTDNYCTLRAAIQEANASAGADDIVCALSMSGGNPVVQPGSSLPAITETVLIEGGLRGVNDCGKMEINGASAGEDADGLRLNSSGSIVRNVAIYSFDGYGVSIAGVDNLVEESIVGTNNAGANLLGNWTGIAIRSGQSNEVKHSILAGNIYAGISIFDGSQAHIWQQNIIGYWPASLKPLGGQLVGISVAGGLNTRIGTVFSERNFIAGNTRYGIDLGRDAAFTTVSANYIGIAQNGAALGNNAGILVAGASNTIGGVTTTENLISGNLKEGIHLYGPQATLNQVKYNLISSATSTANLGDGIKISNGAAGNQIGYNTIGRNGGHGIHITGDGVACERNDVRNNSIGTDSSGTVNRGNGYDGVYITGVSCTIISTNKISYNGRHGVNLDGSEAITATVTVNTCTRNGDTGIYIGTSNNTVEDNTLRYNGQIGLWVRGSANQLLGNQAFGDDLAGAYQIVGIRVDGNHNTLTGGDVYGPLSEVAWHHGEGVILNGNNNTITKYYIHSNWDAGVSVTGDNNVIGASGSDRNIISINNDGVFLAATASGNQVIGNYIGTETSGTGDAGNITGVRVLGSNNQIGGAGAGAGNAIRYSQGANVLVSGSAATGNVIEANVIGPTVAPSAPGLVITDLAANNTLRANQIASSRGAGIHVVSGTGNRLDRNLVYLNDGLGIDLGAAGVSLNDTGDNDGGANLLQNFPVIAAVTAGPSTRVQGSLSSKANTTYTLQFFTSATCDASGYGEAETLLGQTTVTTDGSGKAGFDATFAVDTAPGVAVSATASDPAGNTSELSKCSPARPASSGTPFTVNTTGDAADLSIGGGTGPCDGICDASASAGQQCTLRAAIQEANCALGPDTIILASGTYPLTLVGVDANAAAGDLDITDALTLTGAGADTTVVQSQVADRVFELRNNAPVTLSGITVRGGAPTASNNGGGILVGSGCALTLDAVTVRDNATASGGGGGIYSSGAITLTASAVISNATTAASPTSNGGGLGLLVGSATLINATVSGNSAMGDGGGIHNIGGVVTLRNVTVAYNTADTDNNGGDGGGLWTATSTFYAMNSIIAHNVDTSYGSYPYGVGDCYGTYTSQGYNLIGDQAVHNTTDVAACRGFDVNDSVGGFTLVARYLRYNAGLGALQLNGGSTPNHAPISIATGWTVDRGDPATPGSGGTACEPFDQRGQPRPIDGGTDGVARCDRGAVEHVPAYLSVSDAGVVEGSPAAFTVSLSEPAQITFTVQYSTTAITAVAGQDYTHVAGTLTFSPGQTSTTIQVPTLTDTINEAAETFRLRLFWPQYVFIADGEGTGTITDGNSAPAVLINDPTVTEGDAGTGVQAVFAVTLNSASGKTVTVNYTTADGSAVAGEDYLAVQGQLSFAPGVTAMACAVTVLGDDLREGNEAFTVELSAPGNATLGDATGQGTITDDDTPSISISDAARPEGNSGTSVMTFMVRLSKPSTQLVTVKYVTSPGTAQSGSDYAHTSGTLTFAAGETVKTLAVTIYGDEDVEPHEAFTVGLNTPTGGATIGDGSATGTILDDDGIGFSIFMPLVIGK